MDVKEITADQSLDGKAKNSSIVSASSDILRLTDDNIDDEQFKVQDRSADAVDSKAETSSAQGRFAIVKDVFGGDSKAIVGTESVPSNMRYEFVTRDYIEQEDLDQEDVDPERPRLSDDLTVFGKDNSISKQIQQEGIYGWLFSESYGGDIVSGDAAILEAHKRFKQTLLPTMSIFDSKSGKRETILLDKKPPIAEIQNIERLGSNPTVSEVILSEMRVASRCILAINIVGIGSEAPLLKEIEELGHRGGECLLLLPELALPQGTVKRLAEKASAMKQEYGRDVLAVLLVADPPSPDDSSRFNLDCAIFVANDYPTARVMSASAKWSEAGAGLVVFGDTPENPGINDEFVNVTPISFNIPETRMMLKPFEEYFDSLMMSKRITYPNPRALKVTSGSAPHIMRMWVS